MKIGKENIRPLLDKYMEGETTLQEERLLRDYLRDGNDIPDDLLYARAMLESMSDIASLHYAAPVAAPGRGRRRISLRKNIWAWAVPAAAVVAVAVLMTFRAGDRNTPPVYCYLNGQPVTDYAIASDYADDVLGLLSESLGKPAHYLRPLENIGHTVETLEILSAIASQIVEGDNEQHKP